MIAEAFPQYLLRVLFGGRCFAVLKHFLPLFTLMQDLGCPLPLEQGCLASFAATDPASLAPPALAGFTAGDLGMRLRFFESVLYKDFTVLRAASILEAARDAGDCENRTTCLSALRSAVANLEQEGAEFHKFADWGLSLFQSDQRLALRFALGDSALERLNFAASFKRLEGDVYWPAFMMLVDTHAEVPEAITLARFFEAVTVVDWAGQRKGITNPFALAVADFVLDLEAGVRVQTPSDNTRPGCCLIYTIDAAHALLRLNLVILSIWYKTKSRH